MIRIEEDDLTHPGTLALLRLHLEGMHAATPEGAVFALDLSGLKAPGVTVWTARDGEEVVGIGALKLIGDGSAEIKSMRTHPDHLRRGVGALILAQILEDARQRGMTRLSLETGSGPAFEAALGLYRRHGFRNGEAFGGYLASDFNQFLHLDLI